MALPADSLVPLNTTAGLLVALGERHTIQELADFGVALVDHPRFPLKAIHNIANQASR